jgi:hypothetical protein
MCPHRSIHKDACTSPDGQTHNQIDHILIDGRLHLCILDVRSFRAADYDSDHYLVVANVRERLAVSKRMVKKMDMKRFNLKQLNEEEVKEQYQVTIKISMQFCKTWMIMRTSIGHEELLERT